MKQKYFFLHIPKTAGISLNAVFVWSLGEENVTSVNGLSNFGLLQAESLRKYKLVGGHFLYTQKSLFQEDRYSITFLRNPVDRFLSHYFFSREESLCKVASSHDLAEYIEVFRGQKCGGVMNVQTWLLAGQIGATLSTNELLKQARKNLAKMDFVGISEVFSDSVDLLCYDCKWPAVVEKPVENVTGQRLKIEEIDEKIIDRIKELNRSDIELYQYGLELFNRKKRSILRECVMKNHAGAEAPYSIKTSSAETRGSQPDSQSGPDGDGGVAGGKPANFGTHEVKIIAAAVIDESGLPVIKSGGRAVIRVVFQSSITADSITLGFNFEDEYRQNIFGTNSLLLGQRISVEEGKTYCAEFRLRMDIGEGQYELNVSLHTGSSHLEKCFHWWEHVYYFEVKGYEEPYCAGIAKLYPGLVVNEAVKE